MSEHFQAKVAALAPVGASADVGFEAALEHGEQGFHLNAIAIGREVEPCLHKPPIMASGRLLGGSATSCRDERPHVTLLACKAMIGLRVVASIRSNSRQTYSGERLDQERLKFRDI